MKPHGKTVVRAGDCHSAPAEEDKSARLLGVNEVAEVNKSRFSTFASLHWPKCCRAMSERLAVSEVSRRSIATSGHILYSRGMTTYRIQKRRLSGLCPRPDIEFAKQTDWRTRSTDFVFTSFDIDKEPLFSDNKMHFLITKREVCPSTKRLHDQGATRIPLPLLPSNTHAIVSDQVHHPHRLLSVHLQAVSRVGPGDARPPGDHVHWKANRQRRSVSVLLPKTRRTHRLHATSTRHPADARLESWAADRLQKAL